MVSLKNSQLIFRFPNIANNLGLTLDFQRTLRIPDDGRTHHLPPGLGKFPLQHIEDFDLGQSEHLKKRGGVIMPMYQAEALWIQFNSLHQLGEPPLPVAVKVGAGKINAVSGHKWSDGLHMDPQDYLVCPNQPWLDGFNVGEESIRQFVAAPLGQGYSVEEQIDPTSMVGGLQIEVVPMKSQLYEKLQAERASHSDRLGTVIENCCAPSAAEELSLGMGGKMRQKIHPDDYGEDSWDMAQRQRCFAMLTNAEQWMDITGEQPPKTPIDAKTYSEAGLPWFDIWDGDKRSIKGAVALGKVKSIKDLDQKSSGDFWPEDPVELHYNKISLEPSKVSDGSW